MVSSFCSLSLVFGVEETDLVKFPLFFASLNTYEASLSLKVQDSPPGSTPAPRMWVWMGSYVLSLPRLTCFEEELALTLNVG